MGETEKGARRTKHGESQIKSRDRVRDNGEVFTAYREVDAMLRLLPRGRRHYPSGPKRIAGLLERSDRYLEPACGHGNFLVEILDRKLATWSPKDRSQADKEFHALWCLSSIYGIDIDTENVLQARSKMHGLARGFVGIERVEQPDRFLRAVDAVLTTNIVLGDGLTGYVPGTADPNSQNGLPFTVVEYRAVEHVHSFERRLFHFDEVLKAGAGIAPSRRADGPVHYLALATPVADMSAVA